MARTATKRKNFLGFGKKTTYSPKLLQTAYEAGRKSGDTSAFKSWVARQGDDLQGSFKRRLEKRYRAGVGSLWQEEKREAKKLKSIATKEAKEELGETVKDVADALKNQGLSKSEAVSLARRAYKAGDSFDDVWRKVMKKNPSTAFLNAQKRARSAEKRYISALRAEYGSRAKEMRYLPSEEQSAKIRALGAALRKASEAEMSAALSPSSNPAKFDKCVSKVKRSLKQAKRPGNAYAICAAAGTRTSKSPNAPRLQGGAKRKNAKKRRNYQSVIWSGKQGGAEADVYKTKSGFEVEMSDGSVLKAKSRSDALSIARLKLYELARNPSSAISGQDLVPGSEYADTVAKAGERVYKGVKKSTAGLLKKLKTSLRKKNPIDQAMKVYEDFHGIPSSEVLEFTEEEHYHSVKVGLGLLVSLEVLLANNKKVALNAPGFSYRNSQGGYWDFDEGTPLIKRVLVTSSEDGKQLFFDGGDQEIPDAALASYGFTERDAHDHMVIGEIEVLTYRTQKSFDKGEVVDYFHELGKEGSKGVLPLLLYYPRSKTMKVAGGRYYIAPPDRSIGASPGLVG